MNFGKDRDDEDFDNDDIEMRDDLDFDDDEEEGTLLRWASALFVLAALGGFVALAWYAYKSGVQQVSEDDIPYVSTESGPVKEKPEEPGGWRFEHQDKSVYNQLAAGEKADGRPVAERLMPAPEEPVERAQVEQILPQDFTREEVKSEVVDTPIPATREGGSAESLIVSAGPEPVAEEEKPAYVPVAPVVTEEKPVPAAPVAEEKKTEPKPSPTPAPAPKPVAAPAPAASASVGNVQYMAQLGAFSSHEDAQAAWRKIDADHGSMFPTKEHRVQRADLGAKGVFHRLQLGPFSSETAARKVCEYLQQNNQGCFVVKRD